ncbi:MAG: putative addiction module antidote protein [Rhizobiaceae bacterium]|nr:putative addiction module antidote protein [Rhizobiaceae bacterium]
MKTIPWDGTKYIRTPEDAAEYIEAVFEEEDISVIAHCLGVLARSKGMAQVARDAGLSRESLYRSLSAEGNPELATVLKVIKALGLRITLEPAQPDRAERLAKAS